MTPITPNNSEILRQIATKATPLATKDAAYRALASAYNQGRAAARACARTSASGLKACGGSQSSPARSLVRRTGWIRFSMGQLRQTHCRAGYRLRLEARLPSRLRPYRQAQRFEHPHTGVRVAIGRKTGASHGVNYGNPTDSVSL